MKATINLKIYGDGDEVIEEFETSRVRWGFLEDVIELSDNLEGKNEKEQIRMMGKMVQMLFPNLTDELLRLADYVDIKNCFKQIMSIVSQIEGAEKNV
jgi:hypothetical protein